MDAEQEMQARPDSAWHNEDRAKRMADVLALHQTVLSRDELLVGRFVAIRLADGGSDGVAYDTRADAVEHQRNSMSRHAYFRIPLQRWGARQCDVLLWYVESCYNSGFREDPAHQLYIPNNLENWL